MLAVAGLQGRANPRAKQQIEELDNEKAARLLIHVAKPNYPAIAKLNFIQGNVTLEIMVNKGGRVVETHVADGEPLLAVAAIEAVRKWLYRPYVLPQGARAFRTAVVVKFALHPNTKWGRFPSDPNADLEKQIRPPEVITRPQPGPPQAGVPVKVLVDANGKALDATSEVLKGPGIEKARQELENWKFRPARWGAISVPWYIIVNVQTEQPTMDQAANSAKR